MQQEREAQGLNEDKAHRGLAKFLGNGTFIITNLVDLSFMQRLIFAVLTFSIHRFLFTTLTCTIIPDMGPHSQM